jgi:L-ascorbate metabolism protein UlaG (beta-lactamase superfamily)
MYVSFSKTTYRANKESEMNLQITWYDNAAFRVSAGEETFWFDPSVNKNADSPIKVDDIEGSASFVFTTHGDPGHFINSVAVTLKTGARFVGSQDLCDYVLKQKLLPNAKMIPLTLGETKAIDGLEVHLFEAEHPVITAKMEAMIRKLGRVETSNCGFIVKGKNFTICMLGDCIYSDVFHNLGQKFNIDVGMIPIQGKRHEESTPEEAAENGALIVRDLGIRVLLPAIIYAREQNRLPTLQRKLKEMNTATRVIFARPGTVHTIEVC